MSPFVEKRCPRRAPKRRSSAARAQQDLGRAEGARGEDHVAGDETERTALPRAQIGIGVDDVEQPHRTVAASPRMRVRLDRRGARGAARSPRCRSQRRRCSARQQQVDVERVLGAVVAAGRAVAAAQALVERDAGRRRALLRQRDRDRGGLERFRPALSVPPCARARGTWPAPCRDSRATVLDTALPRASSTSAPSSRRAFAKRSRRSSSLSVRIASGHSARRNTSSVGSAITPALMSEPPPKAVRDDGAHVGADAHVEEPFALAAGARRAFGREAHVSGEIGEPRRKHPRQVFAAALEDADADVACPCCPWRPRGPPRRSRRRSRCRR